MTSRRLSCPFRKIIISMKKIKGSYLIAIILLFTLTSAVHKKTRVLIIGDSISIGYTPSVKQSLVEKANVWHNPGNGKFTGNGLEKLEEWIGQGKWDIIQVNWGLWDLCYIHPDSKSQGNRDKVNGKVRTPIDDYAANLEALIHLIKKKSNAKIIFVTTTVVPGNEAGRFPEDVIRYNDVAKRIMKKNNVVVNDIYTASIAIHEKLGLGEDDVHYTPKGYVELGKLITQFLEKEIDSLKN